MPSLRPTLPPLMTARRNRAFEPAQAAPADPVAAEAGDEEARGRRRGRRGGRRRRRDSPEGEAGENTGEHMGETMGEEPSSFDHAPAPVYTGPTPADPFGGHVYDIFDIMDEPDEIRPSPQPGPACPATATGRSAGRPHRPRPRPPRPASPHNRSPSRNRRQPTNLSQSRAQPSRSPRLYPSLDPSLDRRLQTATPRRNPPAEPSSAPIPPPVLVGDGEPAEKKRGWWRR